MRLRRCVLLVPCLSGVLAYPSETVSAQALPTPRQTAPATQAPAKIEGMTPEEVHQTLGPPVTVQADRDGVTIWYYASYAVYFHQGRASVTRPRVPVPPVSSPASREPPTPAAPAETAAGPAPTPASQEPQYPKVTVGTLTYLQYDAERKNRQGYNAFDVTRGYINVNAELSKTLNFRITPDLTRQNDGSLRGSLVFRLKYAFLEFHSATPRSSLRLGLQPTPWLDFEEGINRYRVQGTMFAERENIIPGSADFGVAYLTRLLGDYAEAHVGIFNGEGFTRAEPNKYKSFQGRGTLRPFPKAGAARGFRLSAFYDLGWLDKDRPRRHGIIMGSFEHTNVVATFQRLTATEQPTPPANVTRRGHSTFFEVRRGLEGLGVFTRFERFTPDATRPENATRRRILGVAYWLKLTKARVGLVFDDENVRYENAPLTQNEHRYLVQTHVQF